MTSSMFLTILAVVVVNESGRKQEVLERSRGRPPKIIIRESASGEKHAHVRVPLTADMADELASTENLGTVFLSREAGDHDLLLLKDVRMKSLYAKAAITDRGVRELENHPTLESLQLRNSNITDEALKSLQRIPRLATFRLHEAAVTDDGIRQLAALSGTEHLNWLAFAECRNVTSKSFQHIATMKSLTRLTFSTLQNLNENDLAHLATMPNLTWLSVVKSALTDRGLTHIGRIPQLKSLQIHQTKVTDAGVEYIIRLKNLKTLGLLRTKITDQGIIAIVNAIPGLKEFVPPPQCTDVAMPHIATLTELRAFAARNTAITDEGLRHLDGLKHLKIVWVPPTVSRESLERLQRIHPDVMFGTPRAAF